MAVGGPTGGEVVSTSRRHFTSSTNGVGGYHHNHHHHHHPHHQPHHHPHNPPHHHLNGGGGGGGSNTTTSALHSHHHGVGGKRDHQLSSSSSSLSGMVSSVHNHHHQPNHPNHHGAHHHLNSHHHQSHHHHQQQQHHQQNAMLNAHTASFYAAAATIIAQPTVGPASNQLLVHHPDYLHPHLQHHPQQHHFQSTNNVYGGPLAAHNNNNNNNISSSSISNNSNGHSHSNSSTESSTGSSSSGLPGSSTSGSNGSTGSSDPLPDRPIGYGAFGVVWSVTDPRDGKVVALKKIPNVFQNLISARRVYREIRMLSFFKHDNVLSALDILQPPIVNFFQEIYVITELMQSDLHKIIVSSQPLTTDHIKVFLYQILRGLKYLHSARILHRDIKPGNLLVNSNCLLKICDFGLARVEEPDRSRCMTQEVVTQYYRAPELLMGARYYTEAIDMWSVGCIFAELLSRRILFQAQTPIKQLDLVTDLLGTPMAEDMKYACSAARAHIRSQPLKQPAITMLYTLSQYTSAEPVHLLCQMLTFNPDKRISASGALAHSYLVEGRARYHSCMCKCCYLVGDARRYAPELEPTAPVPFDNSFEKELTSVHIVKDRLHKEIMARCMSSNRVPLCINPLSATFKNFASSSVAHPSELPPSPHCWE